MNITKLAINIMKLIINYQSKNLKNINQRILKLAIETLLN